MNEREIGPDYWAEKERAEHQESLDHEEAAKNRLWFVLHREDSHPALGPFLSVDRAVDWARKTNGVVYSVNATVEWRP